MATYIMLSNLTDEGRKTLKERPERLQAVNKEIESMGARVTAQYAVLGGYDFVNIIEAPTNEVMARLAVELGSRGTIQITTLPAMGVEDFVEMLKGDSSTTG
ncbi:MAG: GYD domain-containing protein [Gammaproteobacteria bacterium]|nr:GYD domain-containing protein [Gammaproteobacteria bacterium]